MNRKPILGICHGPRCGDYGGKAMGQQLMERSIAFEELPCQSLCPHAPIARLDGKVLHHTNLARIIQESA